MHKLPHVQKRETTLRTFVKHTLLNILALSKIDESLDKCETADDLLTQCMELFARLALQSPHNVQEANAQVRNVVSVSCVVICIYRVGGKETGAPTPATRSAARR